MSSKVYAAYESKLLEIIENTETLPWQKPWRGGASKMARNYNTDKPYRGGNMILNFFMDVIGWDDPYFLTMNQIKKHPGAKLQKGSKGFPIMYYSSKQSKTDVDKEGNPKSFFFAKYYTVYNVADIDGLEYNPVIPEELDDHSLTPIQKCEEIIGDFISCPEIQHKATKKAWYQPSGDLVNVPPLSRFKGAEEYYATLFHELTHSTMHEKRLDRKDARGGHFGDHKYSQEELVAEFGAAFLMGFCGIEKTFDNNAAYLKSWLSKLKSNTGMLIKAARQSAKAVDFIRGVDAQGERIAA